MIWKIFKHNPIWKNPESRDENNLFAFNRFKIDIKYVDAGNRNNHPFNDTINGRRVQHYKLGSHGITYCGNFSLLPGKSF